MDNPVRSSCACAGRRPSEVDALARRLRALPPSCGPVRLVAVDGHAGSGKSTFAARLAASLDGAPVLHLDDLATHDELFDWTDRLREQVLAPFAEGRPARYGTYDWVRRCFTHEQEVPPARVVIIEGVGSGRSALRRLLACLLWMDVAERASWERGLLRDGPALAGFWKNWTRAEHRHFAGDPSRPHANFLVRQRNVGYVLLPGPNPHL